MRTNKELNIDTSKPVLVTGATGYVAGVLIQQLLEQGLTVHATVRDPSKKDRIQYLQDVADKTKGTITFFKGDLLADGSFDEAMKGCNVVFHTASPFIGKFSDPVKELVEPALHGTENVLNSANRTESVKRVVVTSSVAAIYSDASETSEENPLTEEIWNRTASVSHVAYSYSKTLAEQRAWVMAGSQTRWKLVTINPSVVVGPGLKYHETSESYNYIKTLGSNDPNMRMGAASIPMGIVDVREVATAHIVAAFLESASGRHILSAENTTFPQMGQALGKKYSEEYPIVTSTLPYWLKYVIWLIAPYMGISLDRTFIANNFGYTLYMDNSKSKKDLGIDYRPIEESLQEMYQQMIDNDVVKKK